MASPYIISKTIWEHLGKSETQRSSLARIVEMRTKAVFSLAGIFQARSLQGSIQITWSGLGSHGCSSRRTCVVGYTSARLVRGHGAKALWAVRTVTLPSCRESGWANTTLKKKLKQPRAKKTKDKGAKKRFSNAILTPAWGGATHLRLLFFVWTPHCSDNGTRRSLLSERVKSIKSDAGI